MLLWCGWLTPPWPRRCCWHNSWHTWCGTAGRSWACAGTPTPALLPAPLTHLLPVGMPQIAPQNSPVCPQHPDPGVYSPKPAVGGCVWGTEQPAPPTHVRWQGRQRGPKLGESRCEHRTRTRLGHQQLVTKQIPFHSPSLQSCTPGASSNTQLLQEPM